MLGTDLHFKASWLGGSGHLGPFAAGAVSRVGECRILSGTLSLDLVTRSSAVGGASVGDSRRPEAMEGEEATVLLGPGVAGNQGQASPNTCSANAFRVCHF